MNDEQAEQRQRAQHEALLQSLYERADTVDADTASRLANIRRQALAQQQHETSFDGRWWPALGLGSAAVVALALVLNVGPKQAVEDAPWASDAETLVLIQELEVLEELEFLAWLDEAESGAS